MTITFYVTTSEHTALDKTLLSIGTLTGTLKNQTDLVNPGILLEGDFTSGVYVNMNYAYIEQFHRYYFITGIKAVRNNLFEIDMHVDVLYTYRTQIRQNKAFITRQEHEWNLFLNDGKMQASAVPLVETKPYTVGFNGITYAIVAENNITDSEA